MIYVNALADEFSAGISLLHRHDELVHDVVLPAPGMFRPMQKLKMGADSTRGVYSTLLAPTFSLD
jgi:hypothetical protein